MDVVPCRWVAIVGATVLLGCLLGFALATTQHTVRDAWYVWGRHEVRGSKSQWVVLVCAVKCV